MSKYTTEVRYICEHEAGLTESVGYNSIDEVIALSVSKIFDFNYPIFDENYRGVLNKKILKHFYTREIGFETVGLWKHFLSMKMNEIMPYYNMLYKSQIQLEALNPFTDVDLHKDHSLKGNNKNTGDITDNGNTNTSGTNNNARIYEDDENRDFDRTDKYSDTPQGALTGVLSDNYLTNARKIIDNDDTHKEGSITDNNSLTRNENTNNKRTLNTNIDTTEDYFEHIYGKTGGYTYSKMLDDYRKAFMNIDIMVLRELNDLFMGLW